MAGRRRSYAGRDALAYLHLLNGVTAVDAIAFARTAVAEPPSNTGRSEGGPGEGSEHEHREHGHDSGRDRSGHEHGERGGHERSDSRGRPATAHPTDDAGQGGDRDGRDSRGEASGSAADAAAAGPDSDHDPDHDDGIGGPRDDEDPGGDEGSEGPGGGRGNGGGGSGLGGGDCNGSGGAGGRRVVLPEVTVPLATLLGLAERPGENRLLGPLDPALARDLAAAAARSPHSRGK
ncbi:MAG: hypothetical protein ACRDNW_15185 [Trebonia sp.]